MREPTDAEIVAAAKALARSIFGYREYEWEGMHIEMKWICIERAYAALRAAREVRG